MEYIEIFLVILEQNYVPSKLTSHLSEFLGKQPRGQMLEIYRALSNIILQDFILTGYFVDKVFCINDLVLTKQMLGSFQVIV